MGDEYMEAQESMNEVMSRNGDGIDGMGDNPKDFGEMMGYEEGYDDDDGGNNFRGNRGRGNFRNRGRGMPPNWMNGPPPMRFRGRGYGPGGPPMRGRGFFRGRGGPGPRGFGPNNGPNFDNNWGPMGPPPPGMMGGPPPFGPPPGMMPPGGPMGPPPNMMGQPPPFGGPPGMPPPTMEATQLWVETKSDDGKSYYYHARTRETTWTRPQEGPSCKVITQQDMEAMAASGQMPNMSGQSMMNGPMGGPPMGGPMGGPPMGMMGNGMMGGMMPPGVNPSGPPPFMTQPPPWVKDGNKDVKEDMETEPEQDEMPPGENVSQNSNGDMSGSMMPYGGPGPGPGFGGGGFPGGVPPAGWPGWPQPWQQQHPSPALGGGTQQQTPSQQTSAQQAPIVVDSIPDVVIIPKKEETVIPPELAAAAGEWTAHRAPDGRAYYYHAGRHESVWEKPKPMRELEELQAKIAIEKGEKPEKKIEKIDLDHGKVEVIDVEAHAEAAALAAAAAEAERRAAAERERERVEAEKERKRLEKEKEKADKEKADKDKAKQDESRPICVKPISGTPWCVVWMRDGRMFYHNPAGLLSVWQKPEQLIGRADVDQLISQPPAQLANANANASANAQRKESTSTPPSQAELKRAASSDSEDEEVEKAKRTKPAETATQKKGLIDAGAEAAIEAEVRAAQDRAVVPLEQRLRSFREMLHERNVSAFSTWEKELHKIVFDCRYLMLNSKERKQAFDKYVRERAEEERKEKKNRLLQKKMAFRQLMEEAKLDSKSSYTEFSSKHSRDQRFKDIDKPRNRETFFNEYIVEVRKREKEEKERKRDQVKMEFIALLKEKSIDRHARWLDVKKKIDTEARYKAVESSTMKEDYFREYCKIVKEERKKEKDGKEKDRDRSSSKKEKKDKDRDKDKERSKESKKDKKKEKAEEIAKSGSEAEPEVEGEAETEGGASAEASGSGSEGAVAVERARAARAQASIKEREREVHKALATSLRDRDKEREYHKRDECVQHFNALLADLVRNPDLAWREAKKQLRKDHRYALAELLTKDDKERLFTQHISTLAGKRRDKLRAILTELGVSCTASWRSVKAQLQQDPATPTYATPTQMEREFREFQRDKGAAAKLALRQLLLESRALSHRTLASLRDNPAHGQTLRLTLQHDARYLALEHVPEEREQIITAYLEELEKKGPPPPPTATEPCRRSKQ